MKPSEIIRRITKEHLSLYRDSQDPVNIGNARFNAILDYLDSQSKDDSQKA